jgi:amino acid permease
MFSILNEIKNNSPRRTSSVVICSIGFACSIYILVAITGYLSFGNAVKGNIVSMCTFPVLSAFKIAQITIDIPSVASTIGKAAIVVLVMFSYPLQVHPCRASVDAVLKWRPTKAITARNPAGGSPSRVMPLLSTPGVAPPGRNDTIGEVRFAAITTIIIVLSYIVAMTVSSLDKVLAYVGATGSTSISFILPGLFFYKISAPDSPLHQRLAKEDDDEYDNAVPEGIFAQGATTTLRKGAWKTVLLRRLSLALAVYGFVIMIVCLVVNSLYAAQH